MGATWDPASPQVAAASARNPRHQPRSLTSTPIYCPTFQYNIPQDFSIPPPSSFSAPIPMTPSIGHTDEGFKDFSLCTPNGYVVRETELYETINYHAKVRLGYGKALAVLNRELERLPTYERIIRSYHIDQPDRLPDLSAIIPDKERKLFADSIRGLVDIIGLERSALLLRTAQADQVPGIKYEIERIPIPAPTPPPTPSSLDRSLVGTSPPPAPREQTLSPPQDLSAVPISQYQRTTSSSGAPKRVTIQTHRPYKHARSPTATPSVYSDWQGGNYEPGVSSAAMLLANLSRGEGGILGG